MAPGRAASTSGAAMASFTCSTPRPSSGFSTRPASGRYEIFKKYTRLIDEQNERLCTLRGLFDVPVRQAQPVPIEEVEDGQSNRQAVRHRCHELWLDLGRAHETLAIAMNQLGGKSNTGEGGEDPERYPDDDRKKAPSSRWPRAGSASRATTW